ncbi:SGNH/GDSL hydrolase family protein [Pontibacter mangrovi]|uniref:G-D-S-L family lipolytic protein n=1 Tax=Pontibacter mangrovi TaxID=2589816 RepID=A0A501W3E3_9BACT|nr:SGNH/GDSL hydrolase family protein [Pontibacter mangrovi]TPE44423.1 G-D-S-L family lipolytic protein [Pontibacter mangrovi]
MKKCLLLIVALVWQLQAQAQQSNPPFWNEIQTFKQQDSVEMPPQNAILFVGSSSIRKWTNVQEMFPKYTLINRGFGGSTLLDLKRYLNDIVIPYQPKQIVIYSGENDIAAGNVEAPEVLQRFQDVFQSIRQELPQVPVMFVSIKPSPSRIKYKPIIEESNRLIKDYLKTQPKTAYVNVYKPMLQRNGKPKPEIFIQDSLHMNQQGYQIWKKKIKPSLIK